ncbi:metallophosphoesterase family protein [Natronomonas sp. EA1]|uniref:metallophosphoesterase family protein n=1 Tax=Natronomonas sp. EA1 TaxID=3421655 RepID=UPI003EBF0FB9
MRVVIVSDTHIPSRAAEVPTWVRGELREADHVIHAGDFDSQEAYDEIRDLAPALTAVRGNLDPELGLPEVAVLDVEGVRFVVTHGTGDLEGYDDRVAETVAEHADPDRLTVGVSGHTHQRTDRELGGYRVLNPGSATGAEPAPDTSILVVEVAEGAIDVTPVVSD